MRNTGLSRSVPELSMSRPKRMSSTTDLILKLKLQQIEATLKKHEATATKIFIDFGCCHENMITHCWLSLFHSLIVLEFLLSFQAYWQVQQTSCGKLCAGPSAQVPKCPSRFLHRPCHDFILVSSNSVSTAVLRPPGTIGIVRGSSILKLQCKKQRQFVACSLILGHGFRCASSSMPLSYYILP